MARFAGIALVAGKSAGSTTPMILTVAATINATNGGHNERYHRTDT
ncbi:hypothetical protein AB4K05_24155 [Kluyvera sp. STS39-E]